MAQTFHGDLDKLKSAISSAGMKGEWVSDGSGKHLFRPVTGGVINWWESKGTIQIQGKAEVREKLEASLANALSDQNEYVPETSTTGTSSTPKAHQIFIVHGHDTESRDQLELALRRLGLEPFILMNSSGEGKTIIEALEGKIGRDYSSDFGIVLMTPDDMGYAEKDGAEKAEPRARQNVILETGMLLSSLTRERMALVVKGHLEIPSDLQGIIRLGYNNHIREIIPKLCQRLRECGYELDANKIAEAQA